MRLWLLALTLLLPAAAPVVEPEPTPVPTLTTDQEGEWIPFTFGPRNQIRFAVSIQGRPATAILDTGVSHSVLSRDFARAAGLKAGTRGAARAIGGDVAVDWVQAGVVRIGGLAWPGGRMAVIDLPPQIVGADGPVDALIGSDILSCCALDIDYAAQRFRILPSGRMPFSGVRVPLVRAARSGAYLSEVSLGDALVRPILIDTGDGSSLTLTAPAWTSSGGVARDGLTTTIAYGLGGEITADLAIVRQIEIGGITAREVEVRIEPQRGFGEGTGTRGRIGSGLLKRYRVLLDPKAGQMVLGNSGAGDDPVVRSTSGLLVAREASALRVLHVMRGSPAAATGWRSGDRICTIDRVPVTISEPMRQLSSTPGRTIAIGLCDGTVRAMTLAHFY